MREVIIAGAVRSPIGARNGRLSGWHPADLAAVVLAALVEGTGLDPAGVDDVVLGCAMPVGSQGFNVARNAVLAAGWPDGVPGGTVERQGVSSLAAILQGAAAIASGASEVVVAGGVEVMSTTPQGATLVPGAVPFGPAVAERYRDAGGLVPGGLAAEALAASLGLGRDDLDAVALHSHRRSAAGADLVAVPSRVFDRDKGEVVRPGTDLTHDELPQPTISAMDLHAFQPAFTPDGIVTAGNSAAIADGAAGVLLVSAEAAERHGLVPLARVAGGAITGVDPVVMLTGAASAAARALAGAGLVPADVERFEVGECFAPAVVAFERTLEVDPDRVNPAGGGIAFGEPTGAMGARLVTTLAQGLTGRWGLAAAVATGGLGAAVLLERP